MIEYATLLKAAQLIDSWCDGNKIPLNKWITKDGDKYIGIDNETGDCWVEEFNSPLECIKWLTDYPDDEERGHDCYIPPEGEKFIKSLAIALGMKEEEKEQK